MRLNSGEDRQDAGGSISVWSTGDLDEGRSETVTSFDVLTSAIRRMDLGADLRDREAVNQKAI